MICKNCKKEMFEDSGYSSIVRCKNIEPNEEEFIEKHPGLKDKIGYSHTKNVIKQTNILVANLKDIHETQIDKEVIEKAIDVIKSLTNIIPQDYLVEYERNTKISLKYLLQQTIDFQKNELKI